MFSQAISTLARVEQGLAPDSVQAWHETKGVVDYKWNVTALAP